MAYIAFDPTRTNYWINDAYQGTWTTATTYVVRNDDSDTEVTTNARIVQQLFATGVFYCDFACLKAELPEPIEPDFDRAFPRGGLAQRQSGDVNPKCPGILVVGRLARPPPVTTDSALMPTDQTPAGGRRSASRAGGRCDESRET